MARARLLSQWPGFAPYVKRHQVRSGSTQEDVQAFVAADPESLTAAVLATAWVLQNPRSPLSVTATMGNAIHRVCGGLTALPPAERYQGAIAAVDYLATLFRDPAREPHPTPAPAPAPEPQAIQPGTDGTPETSPGDETARQPAVVPATTDSSLFGNGVASSHANVPAPFEVGESATDRETPAIPAGCAKMTSTRWMAPERSDAGAYARITKDAQGITRAVLASLQFRRSAPACPLPGMLSGDLDEGSLDKLALREEHPAIFERREVAALPDVAIAILVDESGSMGCGSAGRPRFQSARLVCTALVEAFSRLRGLNLMVFGHTQWRTGEVQMLDILPRIGGIRPS